MEDLHEEGGGEHEAEGDHDDGQRRVPFAAGLEIAFAAYDAMTNGA